MEFPMRINKYLAHNGIASRREADTLIAEGKVKINGKKAEMGQKVEESDDVKIVGKTKPKTYLAYYKGRGIITHSPAEGETDIVSRLANDFGINHVSPVGRLDKDSEGLMILSNDGRITGPLLDPEAKHEKEYDVLVDKRVSSMFIRAMSLGVDIEGYQTKPAVAIPNPRNDKRFKLIITEGKKHQIRRMCAALGYQVQNLKRVRIGNIKIDKLKPNQYRKIQGDELKKFLEELDVK
ncbi:rRNA pseudouridine synthase [Candidatus Nomurabacteria bacterium]|nr:rRNA pseudouridine synthase [Candidatus Kaiserbacteria bacterium]MCB9810234.1 rRNA pseudouridine synthase [Candidatus Nomurabacteria bacterium]MCB9818118.1 rRNA pseudouridine synthase [Candidatus Nomurabacteria bacterium]